MAKNIKTHLYCYDDHRAFVEDVKKKFPDTARYTILSFQTREEFLRQLEDEKNHNFCKIAILGVHDNKEQFEMIDHLTMEVKKIDKRTGLILLCPPDKIESVRKSVKFNIDAYIPQNANTTLRIHNTVKKLISEHSIGIFRKRRNFSLLVLFLFAIFSGLLLLLAYFKLPRFF